MTDFLRDNAVVLITVAVMGGLFLVLRTRATEFAPGSSLDGMLDRGRPVVLEFFGNT